MPENNYTIVDVCSDADSESDNFSVDSLDNDSGKYAAKHKKEPASKRVQATDEVSISLNKSHDKLVNNINQNYRYDQTNYHDLPFDNEIEQLLEANLPKVDIILPGSSYDIENDKTKFERKPVRKICRDRRSQSAAARAKNQQEFKKSSTNESAQNKSKTSYNHLQRSKSTDTSSSLQAHTSSRSPTRKMLNKFTPNIKNSKRSISYLAQYRGQNSHNRSDVEEDMHQCQSLVSIITSEGDESQFYSDIINGRIHEGDLSDCTVNDSFDHELASVSSQNLKSVSEIPFDNSNGLNYVPYTVKDRLLVLPTKLGSLGPDPFQYKEKAESCKKRQQYGIFASLKNMEMIRHNNLKKKISEGNTDLHGNASYDDLREERWESNSNAHSSAGSKGEDASEKPPRDCGKGDERSKKQPKYGCRKFKKKTQLKPPTELLKPHEKKITEEKTESKLDFINKLLRDRHKNELIIKTF